MDVSFSNVLEGTRQYFQGLPSAAPGPGPGPVPGPGPGPGPGNAPTNQGTDPRNGTAVPHYGTLAGSRPTTLQSSSPTVATSPSILSWQSTPPPSSATVLNETPPPAPTAPAPVPHRHNLPPIASLSTTFSRSAVQKLPPQRVRPRPLPTAQPPKIEAGPVQEPEASKPKDNIMVSEAKSDNELKMPEDKKEEHLHSEGRPSESEREIKEDQRVKVGESQRLDESEGQRLGTPLKDPVLEEKKNELSIEMLQLKEQNAGTVEMGEFRIEGVEIDRTDKNYALHTLKNQLPKMTIFEGKESSQDISMSQEIAGNKASEVALQNEFEKVGIESVDASLAEARSVNSRIDVSLKEDTKSDNDVADSMTTEVSVSHMQQVEMRKAIIERTDAVNNDNIVQEIQAADPPRTQANSPERIELAEEVVAVSEEAQVNRPEEDKTTEGEKHESCVSDEAQNNIVIVRNVDVPTSDQQPAEAQRDEMPTDGTQLMDVRVEDPHRLQIHRSPGRQVEMETTEVQRTNASEAETVESHRAEMQRAAFQSAEDQKLEILRAEEHRTELQRAETFRIDMQEVDPHRIEMSRAGPHRPELQRPNSQRFDIQTTDAQKYEMEETETQRVQMSGVDIQRADMQIIEAQRAEVQREAQRAEIQRIEVQRADMDRIEAQEAEMRRMEAQSAEMQRMEAQRAEIQRVEAQRAEIQRVEAQRAEIQRVEAHRAEMQRAEAQRAEMQRVEAQRAEMQRVEAQRAEMQRVEAQRAEMQRVEAQRAEMQREAQRAEMQREAQRAEMQRVEAQRAEMQRVEAQRAEMQRVEAQRAEVQRVEAQRAEMQRAEAQRAEMQRAEVQRAEMQRAEAQRAEMQRAEAQRAEMQRAEAQRAEMQRVEAQRAEMQRVEAQRAEMQRVEAQRAEMHRVETQRSEMQRVEAQRSEMQRVEAQRVEMQRVGVQRMEAQREMQRVEAQRVDMQRVEAQRVDMQRVETQRADIQRFEAQRAEAQRVEMHRFEAQRAEMQRTEAQRAEMQRTEAQRAEMQRTEAQRAEMQRAEMQRAEMQRTEAQRAEMQRAEAHRADMQRAEAHRAGMQRAEAHRAEIQRFEAQRADIHRLEASRADVQISDAQRAEIHRAEAQQVELQRAEAQRIDMQRLDAQRTEAYRAELQRSNAHKAEVQRVEALRMDAHRTDVQRAELHRTELQNLEAQRDAEKINERRQDAIRYDASKQQSQMYPRHHEREMDMQSRSQDRQRVGQPGQQQVMQPIAAPAPHPAAESPRHRPQPSPVHTLMSPWPQQPSPVPALLPPRHQPAPSTRLENASPHNQTGATYVSSAPASYHQSHLVSPQTQRTAPSPYHHASPSPHNLTPSPHQTVPSPHHNTPSPHHPTPSPRHAAPSPHHGTPSPHHRVSPHHPAAPQQQTLHHAQAHHGAAYSKATTPTNHVAQSPHHTAPPPSQHYATSHHVHTTPSPHPSAQTQNHSVPSPHQAATPPQNVTATQHYTSSHYHYASPSPQQNTTGIQHAAPLQRHVAHHQPQMSAGPSNHSSHYAAAPHHGTATHAPAHPLVPTSHHMVHPPQYAGVPPQASTEPSQPSHHTASHHPEHPAASMPHRFTMPQPRPSQSAPEHPPSSSAYVSSRQQTPYRPPTTAYQQSRQTSPAQTSQPVRLPAQPQALSNNPYRHVQPVSNRQLHPAAVTANTSYRTPSSPYPSQHSTSSNQPASYHQQYQQRLVAPSSQQFYHAYNTASPQRQEALPPVSQIKGPPQQNGGYHEIESQPTRLPPVSSFRSADPARHGQQVYLPTSVASRVTSVDSMPPPPAPNVQQVARTSTPMPSKQYAFPGYPQAQAKQVPHNAGHIPDALGKARLHAQQQSGAPATAASTSAKGSVPQQGVSYPPRPLAPSMDATPSPVIPNGHLPLGFRRESPLDLSVKTVRQSADSTAADDSEVMAILDKAIREPPAATVPKVDFTPNFGAAAVHQHRRPTVNHYPQPAQLPQPPQSPVVWQVPSGHPGVPSFAQTHQNYPPVPGMKRPATEPPGPVAPSKAPCVDSWRATIDMHIEERLSKAEAQQRELKRREQVQHESVIHHAPPVPHFGGADRRTLSILRNSLEERELQRTGGLPGVPSFSGTPAPPQMKFSVPRAIDSVPPGSDLPHEADRMAAHADQDGAAAMAAMARIRTKAELKQWTGPISTTVINSQVSAGQSLYPLLPKDRALLCMNKRAPTHPDGASKLVRGVFDFPDSNSDGEMPVLERQPLRHEKRLHYAAGRLDAVEQDNFVPSTSSADSVKVVEKTEPTEPEDPFWSSACDNFMAQLETGKVQGNLRRRSGGRRKKAVSPGPSKEKNLADLPSSEKAPPAPMVAEAIALPTSSPPSTPTPAAPTAASAATVSKPTLKTAGPSVPTTILIPPVKAKARVGRPPKNRPATPAVSKEPVKRRGRQPRSAVQSAPRAHSESSDREVSPTPSEDHKPLSQLTKAKASGNPKVERMGTRSSGSVRATRSGSTLKTPPKVTRSSSRNLTPEKKTSGRVTRMSKTPPVSEEKNEVKRSKITTKKEMQIKRQIKQEIESSDEDLPLVRKKDSVPLKAEVKADPKKVKIEPKKEGWSESSSSDSDSDETVETVAQRLRTRSVKRKAKDEDFPDKGTTDGGSADASKTSPPKQKNKKKLSFPEGSDFRPGWEDELTKYKRSLRMPPLLINLSRAGSSSQHSASLPDLDTGPNSPALSGATDNTDWNTPQRNVDLLDSDIDSASNCPGMDSDATSSSVISTSTIRKRHPRSSQLLDHLVEKVVNRGASLKAGPRKEVRKETTASPLRAIRRNALKGPEALPTPTPGVFQYQAFNNNKPITNFRDAFRANGMLQHEERAKAARGRGSKPSSNIRAVFGEDKPNEEGRTADEERKSAQETKKVEKRETQVKKEKMRAKIERRRDGLRRNEKKGSVGVVLRPRRGNGVAAGGRPGLRSAALVRRSKAVLNSKQMLQRRKRRDTILATTPSTSTEMQPQTFLRRKMKLRRKFRSGFDYIRKKKRQIKKDEIDNNKDKKKCIIMRPNPESEEDIQAEIRNWVMKKGLGETILHRAAKLGFADVTAFCLEKMDFSPSARDNAGYTPLHVACSRGHTDIAHLLLMYGANVSDSVQGGIRPLHEAAERNHVEMLRLLLSYGADPLLATYSGQTALSLTSPDSDASRLLQNHMRDVQGLTSQKWFFAGPASCFDTCPLVDDPAVYPAPPSPESGYDLSDFEVEMSDTPILPLYQLLSEPSERYVLLNDLLTTLRIKNKRTILKLLDGEESKNEVCNDSGETCSGTCNSGSDSEGYDCMRAGFRVLNVSEFMDQARCCDLLSAGDKVNSKWKKVELIRYNDRVKQLLGVQMVRIPVR